VPETTGSISVAGGPKFTATPCVEVWQTSNLQRLRLGEEKKIERKKEQTTG